jgi:O-antigen ligase
LIEYETAFIDNTLNEKSTNQNQSYNVSIREAWNQNNFHQNSFFPGTALRIYQLRVFSEMVQENPSLIFMGLGLEASQDFISDKANDHNLNRLYAKHNFHNQYIQTLAELGIVGLIILIMMLFVNLKNAVKDKDFLHITFAITMLMLFLSESFFCRQRGIVFFILLYCLFNSASNEELEEIKST